MARPTKLTPKLLAEILRNMRTCAYRETACAAVGIDSKTLRNWLKLAKRGGASNAIYRTFAAGLEEAEAQAEIVDLTFISMAAKADWRAAAWRLARKSPERWGDRQRIEHSGPDGGPIETKQDTGVVMLPPEDPAEDGVDTAET
jgi:hypothetical protein